MAVAYYLSFSAENLTGGEQPERLAQLVGESITRQLGDQPPAGALFHSEGPTDDGGWWVFDVWASEQDFETFRRDVLQPAFDEHNVPPPSEVRRLQVWAETSQMGGGS